MVWYPEMLVAVPVNTWIGEWIRRGSHPAYRGELARQLRLIRQRHGTPHAKVWLRHIDWIGAYPLK